MDACACLSDKKCVCEHPRTDRHRSGTELCRLQLWLCRTVYRGVAACACTRSRGPACSSSVFFFFFQAEDGIRDLYVTGVQTCALPISPGAVPIQDTASRRPRLAMQRPCH